jgi:hypothetical protein
MNQDLRPANCRFRLADEGKAYPRSSCAACGASITTGLGTHCMRVGGTPAPVAAPAPEKDDQVALSRGDQVRWRYSAAGPTMTVMEAPTAKGLVMVQWFSLQHDLRWAEFRRSDLVLIGPAPSLEEIEKRPCPRCGNVVTYAETREKGCPVCGFEKKPAAYEHIQCTYDNQLGLVFHHTDGRHADKCYCANCAPGLAFGSKPVDNPGKNEAK